MAADEGRSPFLADDWLGAVSDLCIDYVDASSRLVELTKVGFTHVAQSADILRAANNYRDVSGRPEKKATEAQVERAEATAQMAKDELAADFPLLHAHSLVGVWGAFDAWTEDLLTAWLVNRPDDLKCDDKRIKVPCSTVLADDPVARAKGVTASLRDSVGGGLRVGLAPIEDLFGTVGLSGPVPDDVSTSIFRAQQVRNVYAHNGGRADDRFLSRCPELASAAGGPVLVSSDMYDQYVAALIEYVTIVFKRGRSIIRQNGVSES